MSHDDFDFEPMRGLPAKLPEGERLLWQGSPDWKSLAVRAYHVRKVAVYFLILALWRIGVGINDGHAVLSIAASCALLVGLGAAAIGVLSLLAYFNARSAIYSITNRRVLVRHGVAVPMTMNVPFTLIDNAALKNFADGTGDVFFKLARRERIGYLITWPHLRPGHLSRPEPSFRSLTGAHEAARILGAALAAEAGCDPPRIETGSQAGPARSPLDRLRGLDPRRRAARTGAARPGSATTA
jgi:hypothetical protein